jgi:hypothetical protein
MAININILICPAQGPKVSIALVAVNNSFDDDSTAS